MTKDFCDLCGDEVTEREDKYISVSCTPEITPEFSIYGKNIVLSLVLVYMIINFKLNF